MIEIWENNINKFIVFLLIYDRILDKKNAVYQLFQNSIFYILPFMRLVSCNNSLCRTSLQPLQGRRARAAFLKIRRNSSSLPARNRVSDPKKSKS